MGHVRLLALIGGTAMRDRSQALGLPGPDVESVGGRWSAIPKVMAIERPVGPWLACFVLEPNNTLRSLT